MIKRILLTIVMLLLIAYLVAAVTVFNDKPAHQVCRDMELVIKDTLNAGFVTKNEVAAILQKKGIYPVGKKMDRVHTKTLEKELDKHPLINEAQCYKTPFNVASGYTDRVGLKIVSYFVFLWSNVQYIHIDQWYLEVLITD
mgnify:CR=1 FL=1